jgi:acylphosphatase
MVHVIISGDVQGVGFRQYTKYQANKLNVKGWIKNLPNGNVEGMFTGERKNLETLIEFCWKGPFLAKVENVKIEEIPDKDFEDFQILKD